MPVPFELVPIDVAKAWAKRLQRSSKTISPQAPWPLTKCQLAVAQMLGFEHWHALNKAAQGHEPGAATQDPAPPGKALPELTAPASREGWMALWERVIGDAVKSGVSDLHIRYSKETTHIKWRIGGKLIEISTLAGDGITRGLSHLMPDASSREFLRDQNLAVREESDTPLSEDQDPKHSKSGYVDTLISVGGHDGRMLWLPLYPEGWEAVIRIRADKQSMSQHTTASIGLSKGARDALGKVASGTTKGKVLVVAGKAGTGKTRLLQAVVNDAMRSSPKTRGVSIGDPPEICNRDISLCPVVHTPTGKDWEKALRDFWSEALHTGLRTDPDLIVMEETHQHSVHATMAALKSGAAVFTTLQAAPGGAINQLQAFAPTKQWGQRVSGWVDTHLLSLLCQECSLHCGKPGRERKRGSGCGNCQGIGLKGRALVVDVWELKDGQAVKLACMKEQALQLITDGAVDRNDAEEVLGRLED